MERLSVAIVGCGRVAHDWYWPLIRSESRFQLTAVCDRDASALASAAREWRVDKAYEDVVQLLERNQVDILLNCSPPEEHAGISHEAMVRAVNVYSEKPLATTPHEARELVNLARSQGCQMVVGPDVELSPALRALTRVLRAGRIGAWHTVSARQATRLRVGRSLEGDWHSSAWGGVMADIGIYAMAAVVAVLGEASAVTALYSWRRGSKSEPEPHGRAPEELAIAVLDMLEGRRAVVQACHGFKGAASGVGFEVVGDEAAVRIVGSDWFGGASLQLTSDADPRWRPIPLSAADARFAGRYGLHLLADIIVGDVPRSAYDIEKAAHVVDILYWWDRAARAGSVMPLASPPASPIQQPVSSRDTDGTLGSRGKVELIRRDDGGSGPRC